jgi:malate dehydrogenase (oxaloacetate-decarboxylating)(NADP+)
MSLLTQLMPRGLKLLQDPVLNKGTAHTAAERNALGLRGLLPPRVVDIDTQVQRVYENFCAKPDDLERYIHLISLQDRNETLFYRLLLEHLPEMMPIVYTPTVGRACQRYGHIYRRARGLYITPDDIDCIDCLLANWPHQDAKVIVVTDGERILGLGDLGANGMGIPVGKLTLYSACAGIDPTTCLPVTLDVGTNNEELLNDPLYIGRPEKRLTGPAYDALIEAFITAVQKRWPRALIQFEDFANHNAFRLLAHWRERVCCFNDDIQGTAAVALAGLIAAGHLTDRPLTEERLLFSGAGEAGLGIGELTVSAMMAEGLSEQDARSRCWFTDSKGLVVASRSDLNAHKRAFAHDAPVCATLPEIVEQLKPTALIGVSGQPQTFTEQILTRMGELNDKPIIFALSNPTSKAECTAEQAWLATGGRAVFASGSPFPSFELDGKRLEPGQGNNAYIFPGVGLGIIACAARSVPDSLFATAAKCLAEQVSEEDLAVGRIYPHLNQIREVSRNIAMAVAEEAWHLDLAQNPQPEDIGALVDSLIYSPEYPEYR